MVRCVEKESEVRLVFYGLMVVEGIIVLVWVVVVMLYFYGIF